MIISKLVLKNWRNFRNVEVSLAERVFIVGPNASGKSNLLDAFRFLRDIARPSGGLQFALAQRGGLSKVRCLSARKEPDVHIELSLGDEGEEPSWRYAIDLTQEPRGHRQPRLKSECVWRGKELILERPDEADQRDPLRLTQTNLEQINANAEFREISRFLESIQYLHLVPQLLRHPNSFKLSNVLEDPYGRNFLETVARTPEKTRKARLKKIEAALREAVPQLKNLTDIKDDAGVPHLEVKYAHWRPNAGSQREDQFSDGTLRMIGLFWSLLEGYAPLLLEEPELSLHPGIVNKLPALFHRTQRRGRRQIFVTTHSWEMLSDKGIGGEELLLLTPNVEGTEVEVAANISDIRTLLHAGLSVADAAIPRTSPSSLQQLELSLE